MTSVEIIPFDRKLDRSGFDCGHISLNEFLAKFVSQYDKRNIGRTYLGITADGKIAGYYTLASWAVETDDLPEAYAKHIAQGHVPVLLLGKLAVSKEFQSQGVGSQLLRDAFQRCLSVTSLIGVFAIYVDAIDDNARSFYEKYGFIPLASNPLKLFLPTSTLASL